MIFKIYKKRKLFMVMSSPSTSADVYEREYFSKYPQYGYSHRKIGFSIDNLWEPKKKILSRKKKDYEPLNPMQTQTDP
jgi:hypothetical protein